MLLQDTVTRTAQTRPEAIALVSGSARLTYGELDALSNRTARLLNHLGCRKGDRVALLLPKSIPAIVGMLAALKLGAVYVPLDTASPAARLGKIIDVCQPKFILSTTPGTALLTTLKAERCIGDDIQVGWLEDSRPTTPHFSIAFDWRDCLSTSAAPLAGNTTDADPAHILFTSGSTGTPKGVVITHRSVAHFLEWATRYFGTAASDRISCHPPLHFDLSTFDIYGTFLAGAELHLLPPDTNLLPTTLAAFIRDRELTQWFSVPAALKYMASFDVLRQNDFPALKRILWCGEALPVPTLIYWMQRLPHATFTNLYGPTETTIASSYYTVPRSPSSETAGIPIGMACDGEDRPGLADSLATVSPGTVGELYIAGVGLSPGYWRDPEKTASVFIEWKGRRIYKTGDLAKTGPDGLIYLLGRSDTQIKSRGYRIELGEIETALQSLVGVRECAVVAIPSSGFEGNAICCAYVSGSPGDGSPTQLCKQLARLLPPYMLPSHWTHFDKLPLNGNGKIDRPLLRRQFQEIIAQTTSARS